MFRKLFGQRGHRFEDTFFDRRRGAWSEIPFTERFGLWGAVAGFERFEALAAPTGVLDREIARVSGIGFHDIAYGSATYPLHPFLCPWADPDRAPRTCRDILSTLHVRNFTGDPRQNLDAPPPDEHVQVGRPPYTDWLHRDPLEQFCFTRDDHEELYDDELTESDEASREAYERLCQLVDDDLTHLVLHERHDETNELVVALSFGPSPRGPWLIGVATQQICHNACD